MQNKIRIVWFNPGVEYDRPTSGGLTYNFFFTEALKKRFGDNAVKVVNLLPINRNYSWFTERIYTNFIYIFYLFGLKRSDIDLVLIDSRANSQLLLPIIFLRFLLKIPVGVTVFHINYHLSKRRGISRKLEKFSEEYLIRNAKFIITISNSSKLDILDILGEQRSKSLPVFIVRPGLDRKTLINYTIPRSKVNTIFQMIFVGNCEDPRKGLEYLIEAASLLTNKNFKLLLVGKYSKTNSHFNKISEDIKRFGLVNQISFLGRVSEEVLIDLYSQSDIFVFPSLWEGYGIALAEAMIYGLPIVATDVGSIPEIVQNNYNGILVPEKDAKAFALGINKLMENGQLRETMKRNNWKSAKEFRNWEEVGNELVTVIEQIVCNNLQDVRKP